MATILPREALFLIQLRLASPLYSSQEKQVFRVLPPSALAPSKEERKILVQINQGMDLVVGQEWVDKLWVAKTEAYFEMEGIVVQELGARRKEDGGGKVATTSSKQAARKPPNLSSDIPFVPTLLPRRPRAPPSPALPRNSPPRAKARSLSALDKLFTSRTTGRESETSKKWSRRKADLMSSIDDLPLPVSKKRATTTAAIAPLSS